MPKYDFNKGAMQLYRNHTSTWVFSPVNLLYIFRTPFYKNTSGWLLLIRYDMKDLFVNLNQWGYLILY